MGLGVGLLHVECLVGKEQKGSFFHRGLLRNIFECSWREPGCHLLENRYFLKRSWLQKLV